MSMPALETGQKWYVAFTQPNGEQRALQHLRNQDFVPYLPRYLKRRRSGRRVSHVITPLFPRYVFVGFDVERQRWRSVNGTLGVSRLICQGERPVPIDARIVEAIAERENDNGLVQLAPACAFEPGQRLQVMDGIFADQLGLCEGMRDQDRVRILLDLLGRKVRVVLQADMVAAA